MPEPMTDTSDDCQPGSSEQYGVEAMTRLPVAQGSRESVDWNGGSGAGSTVAHCDWWPAPCQCSAALEAAQGETAKAQDAYERMADDRDGWREQYQQSRATEAELRAKIEELKKRTQRED